MGTNSRWLRLGVAATLVVAACSTTLRAQTLSDQLVSSESIGQREEDSIERFVRDMAPGLRSYDVAEREAARDALIEPVFRSTGGGDQATFLASRRFRIEYGRRLRSELETCFDSRNVGSALAALAVSAAVATDQVFDLQANALDDSSVGVRYAAAMSLGEVLAAVDAQRAALNEQNIARAIEILENRLATETNGILVDGLARALMSPQGELRNDALSAMCRGLSAQMARRGANGTDEFMVTAFLNAMVAVRDEVRTGIGRDNLDSAFARHAGILGGSAMAFSERAIEGPGGRSLTPGESNLDELAIASEVVAALSVQALRGLDDVPPARLDTIFRPAMERGESSPVRRVVDEWVGDGGVFTQPPFSVSPDDFKP